MTDDVILERADGVAVVTLNRPNALNALARSVMRALDRVLDQIAADRTLRAVVPLRWRLCSSCRRSL
jgi:enoyl-CoA hydratase/carnithine racemase